MIYKYSGLKNLAKTSMKKYLFINGHLPYGVHRFTRRRCEYFTLLRDPIDQAISHFYFIRQCNTTHYKHPLLSDAQNLSLLEFTKLHCNMQTVALAGILSTKIYGRSSPMLLKNAKRVLFNKLEFYGFLDHIEDFYKQWSYHYSMPFSYVEELSKKTINRPAVSDLTSSEITKLREIQSLDIDLYQAARQAWQTTSILF